MSMIVNYSMMADAADAGDSAAGLAGALDATIDAASEALDEGDVGGAQSLLVAAETTADALLAVLGVADADDTTGA